MRYCYRCGQETNSKYGFCGDCTESMERGCLEDDYSEESGPDDVCDDAGELVRKARWLNDHER